MCACNETNPPTQAAQPLPAVAAVNAPYLTTPWAFTRYDDSTRDDVLKRYTLIFQALAALFTIILSVYAFTKKS